MTTATPVITLTGDSLLAFVNDKAPLLERGEITRTEMIKDAGYVYDNGQAMYTEFYTQLLRAKGVTPVTDTDTTESAYEDLSTDEQALYDYLEDQSFAEKWDHEQLIEFMNELDDIGITTVDEIKDSFITCGYTEKEFAQYWCEDVCCYEFNERVRYFIDWQGMWDHDLRYDFNTIDFDYETFYFHNV